MTAAETILTTQGTTEDVMAFFRKSRRTITEWTATKKNGKPVKPLLASWNHDRNPVFGEEDVVRLRAKFYIADEGLAPGEAEARARREWRELLKVRREDALSRELQKVSERMAELDARLLSLERARVDIAA
jgi:hypothetical protein